MIAPTKEYCGCQAIHSIYEKHVEHCFTCKTRIKRFTNQKLNKMNETNLHPLFADIVKSFSNPTTMKTTKTLHEFIEDLDNLKAVMFEQKEAEQVINFILSFRKNFKIKVESTEDGRVKITKL